MLQGNKTFVGQGQIRDVWLVNYKGRALVVKPLRVDEPQKQRQLIRMHRSEIAALDSVSGEVRLGTFCSLVINYGIDVYFWLTPG